MRISDWSSDVCSSDLMGSGIAEVAAKAGAEVILRSRKQESADAMVAALERSLAKQVERGKPDEAAAKEIGGRVGATHDLHDLKDCDLVLAPVVEDLEVKTELLRQLTLPARDDAIIAPTTHTPP